MTNFTKTGLRKQSLLLVLVMLSIGGFLTAQNAFPSTLIVNSPASIAGNYFVRIAAFGPGICNASDVIGDIVLVSDTASSSRGCGSISTNLTGKIALIDRGTCGFNEKAYNAQLKGAIGVIIINTPISSTNDSLFTMAPADPYAALTTIPAFMISNVSGNKLKAALTGTVNVSILKNGIAKPNNSDVIVWGNEAGEGDFDGGLQGWVSNTISCDGPGLDTLKVWRWSANGLIRGGCGTSQIISPTRCNGAVVFESDFYDNGGRGCVDSLFGKGPCPAPQSGQLTSPQINVSASNSTSDFVLKFHQRTRSFTGNQYYVGWSKDNGVTWDSTEVNEGVTPNGFNDVFTQQRVALIGTAGADNLRIRFTWTANYYYWAIDDLTIIEQEANNLQVNTFFAVPQNTATPLAHVESIGFLADIENVGGATQNGVNLRVDIENAQGTNLFTSTRSYGTVPAGALVENLPFPNRYTPPARGNYFGSYTISSNTTDADPSNNTQEFIFIVTDTLFAKDLTGPSTALQPADGSWTGAEHSWAWGQYYYVPNAGNNYIRNVIFGIEADNTVKDKEILINIYKWLGDTNENEQADPNERVSVGFATYTIKGTETAGTLITVPFPNREDPPVKLENNTAYLVMIEYYADDANNFFISATEDIDYAAMILLNRDSLNRPRYAAMLGVNSNLAEEAYSTLGFGYDTQPIVRMSVGAALTSTKELSVLESKFNVFPNPTSDILNVQLNLDQPAQTATVRLFDLSGRMLQQWNYDNIQKERLEYNVNSLSSGTYFLQIITEAGAGTKKFNVTK